MLLKIASFLLENLRYFFFVLGETLPKIKIVLHKNPSSLLGFCDFLSSSKFCYIFFRRVCQGLGHFLSSLSETLHIYLSSSKNVTLFSVEFLCVTCFSVEFKNCVTCLSVEFLCVTCLSVEFEGSVTCFSVEFLCVTCFSVELKIALHVFLSS